MHSTIKDLLFAMLSGSVAELYPREKIIPTTETDRLLMLEPTFIRHNGEVMLLDLGGKSHDPNPKRKGGYTESTFEQAYMRSEEHTSELQSLMRISYAVFCLKKKKT